MQIHSFLRLPAPRGNSQLYSVDLATLVATPLGNLPDPDDVEVAPQRGQDLQGLAWHPTMINPFTIQPGTLIATDGTSDELVAIDTRFLIRNGDIFQLYVAASDENTSIAIAVVNTVAGDPNQGDLLPFQGIDGQE